LKLHSNFTLSHCKTGEWSLVAFNQKLIIFLLKGEV
jgi:hypothetical protein